MTRQTVERRPAGATSENVARSSSIVPQGTDIERLARRHEYALRVVAQRADGVVVTQFYTNLPAAERKVARVRERGLSAALSLVRVVPQPFALPDDFALVAGDA